MKVSDVMTTEVETVQMNSTLEEVASIMKVENVGAVPVVDEDDDLVGIITDRDIVLRCVAEGKDPAETNVEEVFSHDLETIEPDADVEEAAKLMADRQIRRLPVCEQGELVGMLSIGDLAVKSSDHEAPAEALRQISQGVKGEVMTMPGLSMRGPMMTRDVHEGGSRAPHAVAAGFSDDEDIDLEFSEEKDLARSEARERHANRHHQAPLGVKGSGNEKKSLSDGVPKQDLSSLGQNKQRAGISNQDAAEEFKRNARVITFRKDAQVGRRKTG